MIIERTSNGFRKRQRAVGMGVLASLLVLGASGAVAVVIAGPDGTTNTTAPNPDPGFGHVGDMSGLSGTYVRNGWVLTANHVGIGPIILGGVTYEPVPLSEHRFSNGGGADPDFVAFKLKKRPPLSDLDLGSSPVAVNDELILIGNGLTRDAETSLIIDPGPPIVSTTGWLAAQPRTLRWGTNKVAAIEGFDLNTSLFSTVFDELGGPNKNDPEAQAVPGDSGGAAFYWNGNASELVGIMFARGFFFDQGQVENSALFFNTTLMIDIDVYASQIIAVIDQPDCDDGLDEDGDGLIDYPADPGCEDALDSDEQSEALICDNGIDDDMDGFTDFPADIDCDDSFDSSEVPEPGIFGALAAGFLGLVGADRRRRGQ